MRLLRRLYLKPLALQLLPRAFFVYCVGYGIGRGIFPWHEGAAMVALSEALAWVRRLRRTRTSLEAKNKAFLNSIALIRKPRGAIPLVTRERERFS